MVRRHLHYEAAFESYLRTHRVPYLAVDEAQRVLLRPDARAATTDLKSFDLVVHAAAGNLLLDIKGRRVGRRGVGSMGVGRLENWVTVQDLESLKSWESLFGEGFCGAFVFLYWCHAQPPDGLWHEVFEHRGRWYTPRLILRRDYARHQTIRSPRWQTVQIPRAAFDRLSRPFRAASDYGSGSPPSAYEQWNAKPRPSSGV